MDLFKSATFKSIYDRIRFKIEELDNVSQLVSEDLSKNNQKRQEWFSWHSDWKKAWLECEVSENVSLEELQRYRNNTSITKKMRCLDEDF